MMRNWRARERPSNSHAKPLDLSWGTTNVRMGTLGRYLATRLAVRPGTSIADDQAGLRMAASEIK